MQRYKQLFSNSIIFAIGNLGSKMIVFLMMPLYTRYLTTAQYGITDLITTVVFLLTPVMTVSTIDAVFRFSMTKSDDNGVVITNGLFICLVCLLPTITICVLARNINFVSYTLMLTYISAIESMLQQFARGVGKSKLFAITGIITTVVTVICNIFLIVILHQKLHGYLISLVVAQVVGILMLTVVLKIWKYLKVSKIQKQMMKRMLIYGLPLIPNTVAYWLSNSANKVFIGLFLGITANGIYAVANKIPMLISVLYSTFIQAWQISAADEYQQKDASEFFSTVFNYVVEVLIIGVSCLTIFAKPLVYLLATPAYYSAWKIIPWLSLTVLYSSLSSFVGTIYTSFMRTRQLFTSTVYGAIANILFNVILLPTIGLKGAGIGAAFSFALVFLSRLRNSRQFIKINIQKKRMILSQLLIFLQIFSLYMFSGIMGYILAISALFAIIWLNNSLIKKAYDMARRLKN